MSPIWFAQIREDGRVERQLAASRRAKRIVCIGSGGCTALSLLSDEVEVVTAVDSSAAQCALVELKRVAILALDRTAYLGFVGERPGGDRHATYRTLARLLPASARAYWDSRPGDVELGINQCGATERFYRFLGERLRALCPTATWRRLLDCDSIDEQREIHARVFATDAFRTALRGLLSRTTHLDFFPAFMFAHATEHDFADFFCAQFDREVETQTLTDNYFLSQLVFGAYLFDRPGGAPAYLGEDGYDRARRNAGRLVVVERPIESLLSEVQGVDAFFLSNVLDWMDPPARARLAAGLVQSAAPGATVLVRNMLSAHPLPAALAARLVVDETRSADALRRERSMLYRRVTVGALS